jgi:plastocyanin
MGERRLRRAHRNGPQRRVGCHDAAEHQENVLKSAGTLDYYCKFHPNMVGKITVAE